MNTTYKKIRLVLIAYSLVLFALAAFAPRLALATPTDCAYRLSSVTGAKKIYGKATSQWHGRYFPARRVTISVDYEAGTTTAQIVVTTDDNGCYAAGLPDLAMTDVSIFMLAQSQQTNYQPDGIGVDNCDGASWDYSIAEVANGSFAGTPNVYSGPDAAGLATLNASALLQLDVDPILHNSNPGQAGAILYEYLSAFNDLNTLITATEIVCEAEPAQNFAALVLNENDINNGLEAYHQASGSTPAYIPLPTTYLSYTESTYTVAHEFMHHLQAIRYNASRNDYDHIIGRFGDATHYGKDIRDARATFGEGMAHGFGQYVTEQILGTKTDIYNDSAVAARGIWSDFNVGYVAYEILHNDGYMDFDTVYLNDMPITAAFQTLHAFGFYYKDYSSHDPSTYFEAIGIPGASLDDLYDKNNRIGIARGDEYALYPTIVALPYEMNTCISSSSIDPDYWDHVVMKQHECDGLESGSRYRYLSAQSNEPDELFTSLAQSDLEYWQSRGDATTLSNMNSTLEGGVPTIDDETYILPEHNASLYNKLQFSPEARSKLLKGHSRWFLIRADAGGTSIPFEAGSETNISAEVYNDGQAIGSVQHPQQLSLPVIEVPEGSSVVEVWSATNSDVDCFGFYDPYFCEYPSYVYHCSDLSFPDTPANDIGPHECL